MTTRTRKHASSCITSLSTRLSKRVLCAGLVGALLQPSTLLAQAWSLLNLGDASGTWNTAGNWTPATVPNATDAIADFSTQDISIDSTITLNLAATVNRLVFGDTDPLSSAGWTLSPAASQTLTLGGTSPTIEVNTLATGEAVNMNVVLAGSAGMIKNGPGTMTLSKVTTYTGGTTISNGTLKMMVGSPFTGNLALTNPGVLDLNGYNHNSSGLSQLSGNGTVTNSKSSGVNMSIGNNGAWSTFSGFAGGPISFTKNAGGQIAFTGSNTFNGSVRCQGGKLIFNSIGNIGSSEPTAFGTPTTVANGTLFLGSGGVSGGTFTYTGTGHATDRPVNLASASGACILETTGAGPLVFTANFTSDGVGAKTLQLTGTSTATNTIGGAIVDNATVGSTTLTAGFSAGTNLITLSSVDGINTGTPISGTGIAAGTTVAAINTSTRVVTLSQATTAAGGINAAITVAGVINRTSLTKAGSGTWVLGGANTYTGPTTVSDGTLILNGSLAANSTLTVAASKIFGGSGTVYGTATLARNAILKPGNDDIGTLTFANTGNAALTLNTNLLYIALPNVTGPVDKVAISGGLVLNGTNKIVLAYTGRPRSGTHTIMTYASKTTDSTGTFVFDQEYHPTPTLIVGDTSVTVTIPGEGTVLRFQ